jgi:hypothetical protein
VQQGQRAAQGDGCHAAIGGWPSLRIRRRGGYRPRLRN